MNTIYDTRNEKGYLNHYNVFEHIHDFEIVFLKIDDALLVFVVLDSNECLYLIDCYKFLLLDFLFD